MSRGSILVTGGTGYIGSHTMVSLCEAGYTPICVDNGINSDVNMIKRVDELTGSEIPFYHIDLCDLNKVEKLFQNQRIDGVIHFAALKAVGESTEVPLKYFNNNISSLLNVLQCMEKYKCKHFIFSSSCTVYGDTRENPITENTPWKPAASPYGRTKQIGEQIIVDSIEQIGGKAVLLRYFNPAGAHSSGLIGEKPVVKAVNLIPAITETAIGKRTEMHVHGNDYDTRDGSCVRDFIHVMDLADAHVLAMDSLIEEQQSQAVEVYNLGIGEGITVLEAIHAFEAESGVKLNYSIGPRRPGDVVAVYANPRKAIEKLRWKPKYSIEDIMRTSWQWEQELEKSHK